MAAAARTGRMSPLARLPPTRASTSSKSDSRSKSGSGSAASSDVEQDVAAGVGARPSPGLRAGSASAVSSARPASPVELRDLAPIKRTQGMTRSRSISFNAASYRPSASPAPTPAREAFTRSVWPPWSRAGGNTAKHASLLCPEDRSVFFVIDVASMVDQAPRAQLLGLAGMFSELGESCRQSAVRVRTLIRYPAAWLDKRALERTIAELESAIEEAENTLDVRRGEVAECRQQLGTLERTARNTLECTITTMEDSVREAEEALQRRRADVEQQRQHLAELERTFSRSLPHVNVLPVHASRSPVEWAFDWGALVYELTQEHTRVAELPHAEFFIAFDFPSEPATAKTVYACMCRYTPKLWWLRDFTDLIMARMKISGDIESATRAARRAAKRAAKGAAKGAARGGLGAPRMTTRLSTGTAGTGAFARAHPARDTRRGSAPRA